MSRHLRGGFVGILAIVAACCAYALVPSDDPRPARAATPNAAALTRETPYQGVVARLPYVGTLTWRCNREQIFSTRLALPTPGATVTVSVSSDGVPVWRNRRVDPAVPPKRTIAGPFRARETQTWRIRYHHKPATLAVVARLRFAAPRPEVECLVSHAEIDVRRTPH
jgi:hypothetical protein